MADEASAPAGSTAGPGASTRRGGLVAWAERRQVSLYLAALAFGAGLGLALPWPAAAGLAAGVNPTLGLLLFSTFRGVPFARLAGALRDWRFLLRLGLLNFLAAPVIVFCLSRFVAGDAALLLGVLLVLLCPCVDYVIVFTGLAGGAADRLLAATPLLMCAQALLLPGYLWLFAGPSALAGLHPAPFVEAFVTLILLPLVAALTVQALERRLRWARYLHGAMSGLMVPIMMVVLALVVASQISGVVAHLRALATAALVFVLFAVCMTALGWAVGLPDGDRIDVPARRALLFSGVTRNSLVVLPLALATGHALTPVVVVTQTLVELFVMVTLVWAVPKIVSIKGCERPRSSP
ncbi:arsenic resistance protein [Brevibacterium sp. 91QC2O2]|uniref:arsenic resistance protein n=1 Tax=Brevibacterium sp. 91QC2O2 TaxID=2968458 RepID=UPI0027B9D3C7|nr:arsenic resistance protein [Brevibacterium sp. 91QC2O2]